MGSTQSGARVTPTSEVHTGAMLSVTDGRKLKSRKVRGPLVA